MDERVDELIETLDALLGDLAECGCHFVVSVVYPDLTGSHYRRTRNVLVAYGLAEVAAAETHSALTAQD
ncbi:MAG: hypothetical protein WHX60_08575 [Armatimonadota bacterium]